MNKFKRIISIVLVAVIILTALPLEAFAMQIFVKVESDTAKSLDVEPTDRIEDLKALISDKTGIPVESQILTFGGKTLEEGNTLQDYSVQKDSEIIVSIARKITKQPTAENAYTVGVSYAEGVSYQWYTASESLAWLSESDTIIIEKADAEYYPQIGQWLLNLGRKSTDAVKLTLPKGSTLRVYPIGSTEIDSMTLNGSNFVFTGTYWELTLEADVPAKKLKVNYESEPKAGEDGFKFALAGLGAKDAVSGQTNAALDQTNLEDGKYICRVTWSCGTEDTSDDVVCYSDAVDYTAVFIPVPQYEITNALETDGKYWVKYGESAVIVPSAGYTVSKEQDGTYSTSVTLSETDLNKTVYFARESDGKKTDAVDLGSRILFDGTAPIGTVSVKNDRTWNSLIGKVSFGLFYKEYVEVGITATDGESGVDSVEYYVSNSDLINSAEKTYEEKVALLESAINSADWKTYSGKFSLGVGEKYVVYAKITDKVGNVSCISSDGVVLYGDSSSNITALDTGYKSGSEPFFVVYAKGNTIKDIALGNEVLEKDRDYSISYDETCGQYKITLLFLDSLDAGSYRLNISVNPLGESYVEADGNQAPSIISVDVNISKADGSISNISDISKVYDGVAVSAPTFESNGNGDVTVEYKAKGEDDSEYTNEAPVNVGEYVVRITVGDGTNHKMTSETASFSISRAEGVGSVAMSNSNYGETASVPVVECQTNGTGNVSFFYKPYGASDSAYSDLAPMKAGKYTVKAVFAETENYTEAFATADFEIFPKELNIIWGNTDFVYDGTEKFPEFIVGGVIIGDDIALKTSGGAVDARHEYMGVITGIVGEDSSNYKLPSNCSKEFSIAKADRSAPSISKEDETISCKADGKLIGVSDTMEYRAEGETNYTAITSETVEGLANGKYFVRYKESDNYKASPETEVSVSSGRKMHFTLPSNPVGYSVTTSVMEYDWKSNTMVYFELMDGYSKTENFKLMLNGVEIELGDDTSYPLSGMIADCTITVEGVADVTAPKGEIKIRDNKWTEFWCGLTFGLLFNESQEVTITAEDAGSGVSSIEYFFASDELDLDAVKAIDAWSGYNGAFKIDPNDLFIIYVKLCDNAGNITYLNSDGVTLDNIPPVLEGIENGKTYYGDLTVVKGNGVKSVTLDGEPMGFAEGTYGKVPADNKQHKVVAEDYAGNKTVYEVTVFRNYTVTYKADGKVISEQVVGFGKDAVAPVIPEKAGYNENAPVWDKDGKNITEDTVINALYTKNEAGEFSDATQEDNFGGALIKTSLDKLAGLVKLTDEEKQKAEFGADVLVWLEVKDISASVSGADKALIAQLLENRSVGVYLDVAMFKQIGNDSSVLLTEMNGDVSIGIKLSEELMNSDEGFVRAFDVIRVHNGKAEFIASKYDEATGFIVFETDRFSTYAIVYADTALGGETESPVIPEEPEDPVAPEEPNVPDVPQTGVKNRIWLWSLLIAISGVVLVLMVAFVNKPKKK